jgi:hypothetical protein
LCNNKEPVTLADALKQITEITGISVIIDLIELRKPNTVSGIKMEIEKPLNFYFPFKPPLHHVLDYLTKQQNLAWIVLDDHILITSKKRVEEKENESYLYTYYVGDLSEEIPKLLSEKEPSIAPSADDSYKPIIDYITVMIDSETWDGNIMIYSPNKSLVIRKSNSVHKQIEELLKALRQFDSISDNATKNSQPDFTQTPPTLVHYYQRYDISDLTKDNTDTDELVDLILAVVAPDHWKKSGGQGIITVQENCCLFVFQEHRIHVEITGLLEQVRAIK